MQAHKVQLDRIELGYLTWGSTDAPKLLLLHGYLDNAHGWARVAESLAETYYVIAPHFRGHGTSSWAPGSYGYSMMHYVYDLALLMEHLKWHEGYLMGHSMGANCAGILAGTYPGSFVRLIMVEGFGVPTWQEDDAPERLRAHIERRKPETLRPNKTYGSLAEVADRIQRGNPTYSREHAEFVAAHSTRQTDDGSWEWTFDPRVRIPNPAMYLNRQFQAFWRRIEIPTLHVIGADSPSRPFASMAGWNMPQMSTVYIPGAMHMVQHDSPSLLSDITRDFLSGEEALLATYGHPQDT